MQDHETINRVPLNELHQEPGAHELATSAAVKPYLKLAIAVIQGADLTSELDAIGQLPLEQRYVLQVPSGS